MQAVKRNVCMYACVCVWLGLVRADYCVQEDGCWRETYGEQTACGDKSLREASKLFQQEEALAYTVCFPDDVEAVACSGQGFSRTPVTPYLCGTNDAQSFSPLQLPEHQDAMVYTFGLSVPVFESGGGCAVKTVFKNQLAVFKYSRLQKKWLLFDSEIDQFAVTQKRQPSVDKMASLPGEVPLLVWRGGSLGLSDLVGLHMIEFTAIDASVKHGSAAQDSGIYLAQELGGGIVPLRIAVPGADPLTEGQIVIPLAYQLPEISPSWARVVQTADGSGCVCTEVVTEYPFLDVTRYWNVYKFSKDRFKQYDPLREGPYIHELPFDHQLQFGEVMPVSTVVGNLVPPTLVIGKAESTTGRKYSLEQWSRVFQLSEEEQVGAVAENIAGSRVLVLVVQKQNGVLERLKPAGDLIILGRLFPRSECAAVGTEHGPYIHHQISMAQVREHQGAMVVWDGARPMPTVLEVGTSCCFMPATAPVVIEHVG